MIFFKHVNSIIIFLYDFLLVYEMLSFAGLYLARDNLGRLPFLWKRPVISVPFVCTTRTRLRCENSTQVNSTQLYYNFKIQVGVVCPANS